MKIIVRSPNWIGDCVMCLPAIRALKSLGHDHEITIVTKPYLRDVFINIPEIAKIWTLPDIPGVGGLWQSARSLRNEGGDAGILFTNSFHSALLFKLARIPNITGYNKDLRGFLLHKSLPFPNNDDHHIYFYLDLVEAFTGEKSKELYPNSITIIDPERQETENRLKALGVDIERPMLGISPSAAYGTAKQWEPASFSELIDRLMTQMPDLQILLLGSQFERRKISIIADGAGGSAFNVAGQLSLRETFVAISMCDCFVGNDSGLLHIASAVDVPYVGIFGPTIPHKTAPLSSRSRVLYKKADCAPCKHRDCPLDHRCMKSISVQEVSEAVMEYLPVD